MNESRFVVRTVYTFVPALQAEAYEVVDTETGEVVLTTQSYNDAREAERHRNRKP